MNRAKLSLDGLSIGDAFCSQFFVGETYLAHFANRTLPLGPWRWTDDTAMALSIIDVLEEFGCIEQYALADAFAERYMNDTYRGYGPMAHEILRNIYNGDDWQSVSHAVFNGTGSMGNGAAMRVAPLGAYFANDLTKVVTEADLSAEVTHAHPEGRAGAVAVAVAAALAWQWRDRRKIPSGELLRETIALTPAGLVREGLRAALDLPRTENVARAARVLGNGSKVTAPDTVPLALWLSDRHLNNIEEGLWAVLESGGDVDTLGAMVGGVVNLRGAVAIGEEWLAAREPFE
jgi:ADP-ribosylglycohydrolase